MGLTAMQNQKASGLGGLLALKGRNVGIFIQATGCAITTVGANCNIIHIVVQDPVCVCFLSRIITHKKSTME
jgi:hypothetical protein